MSGYKAVLFAPDGDWVTDHRCETIEDVADALADQGSRWYFYPYQAVIRDNGALTTANQRIVDACEPFDHLVGRTIRTMSETIATLASRPRATRPRG